MYAGKMRVLLLCRLVSIWETGSYSMTQLKKETMVLLQKVVLTLKKSISTKKKATFKNYTQVLKKVSFE